MALPDTTTTSINRPTLLTIPPDLRLSVYDHLFSFFKIIDTPASPSVRLGILTTCRLIQTKALDHYKTALDAIKEDEKKRIQDATTTMRRAKKDSISPRAWVSISLMSMREEWNVISEEGNWATDPYTRQLDIWKDEMSWLEEVMARE